MVSLRQGGGGTEPERQLSDRILKTLAGEVIPLTVVVDEDLEVVYTIGDTRRYFRLPDGRMENDIRRMLPREIAVPISIGIQKALKGRETVSYSNVQVHGEEGGWLLQITVMPLVANRAQSPHVAVLFREMNANPQKERGDEKNTYDYNKETEQRIFDLEQDLQFTKENLQATIEELETSNEELQATNEELLASNEELQSTNEELQSVNEELYTVNSEHQRKIMELTELNNDIDNLLISTEIGTIFLDENLNVRKFSPLIQEVFNVISSDIGRPFDHLTYRLQEIDVLAAVQGVLRSGRIVDHKVCSSDGRWFLLRILPYNVAPGKLAGVILTVIEISDLVQTENSLEEREARLDLAEQVARFASWQWDIATGALDCSGRLEALLGHPLRSLERTYEAMLASVHPEDRQEVIDRVGSAVEQGKDYETVHRILRPDGSVRTVKEVGVATPGPDGKAAHDRHHGGYYRGSPMEAIGEWR